MSTSQDHAFVHAHSASGALQANLIKSLLEAAGITVLLSAESAGAVIGLTMGALGTVDVWVPSERLAEARQMIAQVESAGDEVGDTLRAGAADLGE